MYRLLLIAQPTESTDSALWKEQNFDPVCICPDVCSALKLHAEKHFDAIGVTDPAVYKELYEPYNTGLTGSNIRCYGYGRCRQSLYTY